MSVIAIYRQRRTTNVIDLDNHIVSADQSANECMTDQTARTAQDPEAQIAN